MPTTPRIAIIGSGPGGLVLARILRRHGFESTVFESEPRPSARPQGGSLDMHPESGQHAIEQAGLSAEFKRIARYEDQEARIYNQRGDLLFFNAGENADRPEVDRGQLRAMLLDSLPLHAVRWGQKLSSVEPGNDGTFSLVLKGDNGSGSRPVFDLVVGADGTWSRVRPLVSPAKPIYSGIAMVEFGIDDVDRRHPAIASLAGHGLTFALGDGKALIAHRDADAHVGCYAGLRVPATWANVGSGSDAASDLSSPAGMRSALLAHFPDWSQSLRDLLVHCGDRIVPRPLYALPVGHRWPNRPGITLLGDAAHVMSPMGGAGANLAMRDAADLALALVRAFARPHGKGGDWRAAVAAYEETMFARAAPHAAIAWKALDRVFSPEGLNHALEQMGSQLQPQPV